MNKTRSLIILGSIIIGLSFLLLIYFVLISIGIIQARSNELVLRTDSVTVEYTGLPHKKEGIEIVKGNLAKGHRIDAIYTGSQTNIGIGINSATAIIYDEGDNDVTRNYDIVIEFGEIEVTKRSITFESKTNKPEPFDGTEFRYEEYKINDGTLLEGHYYKAISTSSLITPGTIDNTFFVNIFDSDNNKVNDNYDIKYVYGRLEVEKINVQITSESAYKVYDGKKLEHKEFYLGEDTKLLVGHRLEISFNTPVFTEVGSILNEFTAIVKDEKGIDVTNYYNIIQTCGTLTIISSIYSDPNIAKSPFEYDSSTLISLETDSLDNIYLRDFSFGEYDEGKWQFAKKTNVALLNNPFNFVGDALKSNGYTINNLKVSLNRKQIPYLTPNFTTNNLDFNDIHNYGNFTNKYTDYETTFYSYNYIYDGALFSSENILDKYNYRNFIYNNYLKIDEKLKDELIRIGNSNNIWSINKEANILDIKNYIENVASFDINFSKFPEDKDPVLYFLEDASSGIAQHFASAAVLMYRAFGIPARYVTGYFSSGESNRFRTLSELNAHAWVEVYVDEMGWVLVEVTNGFDKDEIEIRPWSKEKIYDGKELYNEEFEYDILNGKLRPGHKLYIETNRDNPVINVTEPKDKNNNKIDKYRIEDRFGNDVTHHYKVKTRTSDLVITKRDLFVSTNSLSKEYNGTYQDVNDNLVVEYFGLAETDKLKYSSNISLIKDVGKLVNSLNLHIENSSGESKVDNYNIKTNYGEFKINPKLIKISGITIEKYLDELPDGILKPGDLDYILEGEIYPDDNYAIYLDGVIDFVGETEYEIYVEISSNYKVITKNGTLRVLPPR